VTTRHTPQGRGKEEVAIQNHFINRQGKEGGDLQLREVVTGQKKNRLLSFLMEQEVEREKRKLNSGPSAT